MVRVSVFGGTGFVGKQICKNGVKLGQEVLSFTRTGLPAFDEPWAKGVKWLKADVLHDGPWIDELKDSDAVVSCIGAFGSDEFMQKINGDLNIKLVSQALNAGVKRFVYISTVENNLPSFVLKGYFEGKRRAEEAVLDAFPQTGTVLRPGFMYGSRNVGSLTIPLWLVGRPMEQVLSIPPLNNLQYLPGMRAIFACPLDVNDVGLVAAAAAGGVQEGEAKDRRKNIKLTGILSIPDIQTAAKSLR